MIVLFLIALTVKASAQEADQLAVLRSNASIQAKSTACRLLAQVGHEGRGAGIGRTAGR